MCIAIVQTKGRKAISKDKLRNCWTNNPDGAGLVYAHGGKLYCKKELKSFDAFYALYQKALSHCGKKSAMVLHFRTATHGNKNCKANTHPFFVSPHLAFVHNGIISGLHDKDKSDTRLFCEMLRGLKHSSGMSAAAMMRDEFSKLVGCVGSKFIFLNDEGRFKIVGSGIWNKGVWYSNNGYLPAVDNGYVWRSSGSYKGWERMRDYTAGYESFGTCAALAKREKESTLLLVNDDAPEDEDKASIREELEAQLSAVFDEIETLEMSGAGFWELKPLEDEAERLQIEIEALNNDYTQLP